MSEPGSGRAGEDAGSRGFGTAAVHGADAEAPLDRVRPHVPPIVQSSAFEFPDVETAVEAFRGGGEWIYTRKGNPTVRALERHVAALERHPVSGVADGQAGEEGGDGPREEIDARAFASGMAAITCLALGVAAGGRLVCQDGIYGTTVSALQGLRRFGLRVDFVPVGDLEALRAAARQDPPPALIHIETPANPLLQVTDVRAAARLAHQVGAALAVDATFATPALLRPLAWGADFVVHSTTKFISGHGAALGGVVSGRASRLRSVLDPLRKELGGVADPFASWLTLLGLRTLDVRMARHAANAAALATMLREHPRVRRVFHPDPAALPAGQLAAGGPMLSFEVEDDEAGARAVMDRLRLAALVPTLGTVDTLIQHPYTMSHAVLSAERRRRLGIEPGIVRVSVGLEDRDDLLEDFRRALEG